MGASVAAGEEEGAARGVVPFSEDSEADGDGAPAQLVSARMSNAETKTINMRFIVGVSFHGKIGYL
ncbi:MAG: hypothetical protein ABFC62_06270 [Clostridiaceae bacterium]|nr:hypothetical protein [Eubacteriales bacterium]